jgi:hypothetical protein
MKATKHLDTWEWLDFVRGAGDPAGQSAKAAHLSAGCERCQGVVRGLQAVAAAAVRETLYEPPASVLRRAQAIFPLREPGMSVFAKLIIDNFQNPLPAGLRSQGRLGRHALYEAGDFFVDLLLEKDDVSGTVTLVGQVSDRVNPRINTVSLPVLLMSRRGFVATAMCNRLGEFGMQFRPARNLRLYVPLRESGERVDVRMDDLLPPTPRQPRAPKTRKLALAPKPTQQ